MQEKRVAEQKVEMLNISGLPPIPLCYRNQ